MVQNYLFDELMIVLKKCLCSYVPIHVQQWYRHHVQGGAILLTFSISIVDAAFSNYEKANISRRDRYVRRILHH
jgi:hypothetical protein